MYCKKMCMYSINTLAYKVGPPLISYIILSASSLFSDFLQ